MRDGQSEEFMRVNSDSPNNSVLSTETSSSDSCYASGEVEETEKEEEELLSEEKESQEALDIEVPTLRRKKDRSAPGTRQGPRVTRNLTEEQIMSQLQDACVIASPWLYYDKVGKKDQGLLLNQDVAKNRERPVTEIQKKYNGRGIVLCFQLCFQLFH